MSSIMSHLKYSPLAKLIVLFQLFVDASVILNIEPVRQIAGFIYLTFIPGIVVLRMLKLDKSDSTEFILFSVGSSIVIVMLIGLFVNFLFPLAGIGSPLSTLPFLVVMNAIVLLPCLLGLVRGGTNISKYLSYRVLILAGLPLLSVLGVFLVNNFGDNNLLLLMLFIIPLLIGVSVVFPKSLPAKYYPFTLLAISIALLLHQSLITNFLVGYDVHGEYYVYKLTEGAAYWNPNVRFADFRLAKGNNMLSVTILPTIYSEVLSMDGTWIFKIVYPLLLAFLPVALYKLYRTQTKEKTAFLSVFFFLSLSVFFNLFAAKQMIAEIFLILLLIVVFEKRTGTFERSFFFIVFSAGLVVSHYSTSYLFLFQISFVLISIIAYDLLTHGWRLRAQQVSDVVTISMVLLFSALSFGWYIFTSYAASFDAILDSANFVSRNIWLDFFNPEARSTTVLQGIGLAGPESFGHLVGRIFFYATELFIAVGVVKLLFRRKEMSFTKEYTLFSFFNMGILAMAIVLPNFAGSFRMERFFELAVLILAPLCVIGGETLFKYVLKNALRRKNEFLAMNLILMVLIPLFWFQTGFVFEVTGDTSYSLPLSMNRMDPVYLHEYIVEEQEVASAQWLMSQNQGGSNSSIYADTTSAYHVLTSYGFTSLSRITILSDTTRIEPPAYVYLRPLNVREGVMIGSPPFYNTWNTSEISPKLEQLNLVYSNGASVVYEDEGH